MAKMLCLVGAVAACTGQIGSDGTQASSAGPPATGATNTSGGAAADNQHGDDDIIGNADNGTAELPDADGDGLPDEPTTIPTVPPTDVGTVMVHRLNNTEYNNTVRDLLGTSATPADAFPLDGSGAGFDNIAQVLSLSPNHLVALQSAAESLAAQALADATQRANLVTCDLASQGAACAKASLFDFVQRAWRRPVAEAELSNYYASIDSAIAAGDSSEQALAIALEGALLSPHFLFRIELDPDPTATTPRPLNGHELASRLSYFLWSSMPDDALFARATAGTLTDPTVLNAEVSRMLQDPKARALVENFAGQWLYLRKVDEVTPNSDLFPGFDASLQAAMKRETELLFSDIVFNGAPVDQLLLADYTYANGRLTEHYGLPSSGSDFSRVDLTGNLQRPGGLLSHGSVLTVTSHQARTSPVLRGKWVMSQLLCTEIKPPPPDVDTSLEADEGGGITAGTLREQLEQHRADPQCAACHNLMDPIGLGLENFDAVGGYRTSDAGTSIDPSGILPDGSAFAGAADLRQLIASDPSVMRCLVKNLYTYALGRVPATTPEHYDVSTMLNLREKLAQDKSFTDLITGIVQSTPFLQRRGDPTQG